MEPNQQNDPFSQPSPQIIKINADYDTKQRICFQWVSFFVITSVLYLCTLAVPDALYSQSVSPCQLGSGFIGFADYDCKSDTLAHKNPRALYISNHLPSELFLWVQATLTLHGEHSVSSTENITYQFSMWEVKMANYTMVEIEQVYHRTNHSVVVQCDQAQGGSNLKCEQFTLAYIPQIHQESVLIIVEIVSPQKSRIQYFDVSGVSASGGYTKSLIAIRYTFMGISVFSAIWYGIRLYKLNSMHHIIEQKMVFVLSVLVIFFDDPLYAITVLIPNKATSIIGVIFLSNFLVFLMMFWMVLLDRMVNENGQKETNAISWQKITVCFLFWLCVVISYILVELKFYSDPSSTYEHMNSSVFFAFKVMSFILAFFILAYICVGYYNFCKQYSNKLWRYRVHGLFSLYFTFCFALFLFTGSFQLYQFDGTRILLAVSILNLYIYYMQYLWAPSEEGIKSQEIECRIEMQASSNLVYDQLDEDGLKISFRIDSEENNEIPIDEIPVDEKAYNNVGKDDL